MTETQYREAKRISGLITAWQRGPITKDAQTELMASLSVFNQNYYPKNDTRNQTCVTCVARTLRYNEVMRRDIAKYANQYEHLTH